MAGLVRWITRRRVGVFVASLLLVGFGLGSSTPAAAAATQQAAPAVSTTTLAPGPGATPVGTKGGKLSSRLLALSRDPLKSASESAQADALSLPSSGAGSLVRHEGGRVVVQVRMSDVSPAAIERLTSHGVHVISTSPDYGTVTVDAPPGALGAIADDPDVTYASEVLAPRTGAAASGSTGLAVTPSAVCAPTISEADSLMNVAATRAAKAVDGSGETVGILSDSFDTAAGAPTHASTDIATGDLPGVGNPCGRTAPVVVQSDFSGGGQTDEGRAMAQLVHDLAPGAHLAFATAFNGDLDFANQINTLRAVNHADVIVDDVSYLNEPFFQNGPIATAANTGESSRRRVLLLGRKLERHRGRQQRVLVRGAGVPRRLVSSVGPLAGATPRLPRLRHERWRRQRRRHHCPQWCGIRPWTSSGRSRGAASPPTTTCSSSMDRVASWPRPRPTTSGCSSRSSFSASRTGRRRHKPSTSSSESSPGPRTRG